MATPEEQRWAAFGAARSVDTARRYDIPAFMQAVANTERMGWSTYEEGE